MPPRFNGLWRHRDFVRLWTGETISIFGSLIGQLAMQFTAIIWLHASALQISVLAMAQLIPGFLVGIAAGVWVDRLPRRPILIAADIGRAALITSVPVAAVFGVLTLEQLYAVAAGASALTVCFNVAYEAYLPSLVATDELVEGNSKLQATASMAEFGSFSLSGWLVQILSGPGALLIDAVSFIASAGFVAAIRSPEPPRAREEHRSFWREAHDGLRLVVGDPLLRSFAVVTAMREFSSRLIGTVILLYLYREVGFSAGRARPDLRGRGRDVALRVVPGAARAAFRRGPRDGRRAVRAGDGRVVHATCHERLGCGGHVPRARPGRDRPGVDLLRHQRAEPAPGDHAAGAAGADERDDSLRRLRGHARRHPRRRPARELDRPA